MGSLAAEQGAQREDPDKLVTYLTSYRSSLCGAPQAPLLKQRKVRPLPPTEGHDYLKALIMVRIF